MKLSEWASRQGVSYQTAWRSVKDGKMPVPVCQAPSGTWIVEEAAACAGRVVAYCRVSSGDQKGDLDRQAVRVVEGANAAGLAVGEIVKEVGSGLNGQRRKLHRFLVNPSVAVIVVELGTGWPASASSIWSRLWPRPAVAWSSSTPQEAADDLMRDMTEVLTSMCARLYGRRSARRRAEAAVSAATGEAAE